MPWDSSQTLGSLWHISWLHPWKKRQAESCTRRLYSAQCKVVSISTVKRCARWIHKICMACPVLCSWDPHWSSHLQIPSTSLTHQVFLKHFPYGSRKELEKFPESDNQWYYTVMLSVWSDGNFHPRKLASNPEVSFKVLLCFYHRLQKSLREGIKFS